MGQKFFELSERHIAFIGEQKLFFVGTATDDSRVNISPKGMDSLRVLSPTRVLWLNVTGSGNETAAHLLSHSRMTILFCAFEGAPLILRLYGQARAVHRGDAEWAELLAQFPALPGARQIFDLQIDLVQSSCGMAVPFFDYQSDRELLKDWAHKRGDDAIKTYWAEKNQRSLDGKETEILQRSGLTEQTNPNHIPKPPQA